MRSFLMTIVAVAGLAMGGAYAQADDHSPFQLLGTNVHPAVTNSPNGAAPQITPVRWGWGGYYRPYYRPYYGGYYNNYYRPYSTYYRPYYGGYGGYYQPYYNGYYGNYYRPYYGGYYGGGYGFGFY